MEDLYNVIITESLINYFKIIGLVNKNTVNYLKKIINCFIYKSKFQNKILPNYNNSNYFLDEDYLTNNISEALVYFYKTISLEEQMAIAKSIYKIFLAKKLIRIDKKILNLFFIYRSLKMKKYFNKWKTKIKKVGSINNHTNYLVNNNIIEYQAINKESHPINQSNNIYSDINKNNNKKEIKQNNVLINRNMNTIKVKNYEYKRKNNIKIIKTYPKNINLFINDNDKYDIKNYYNKRYDKYSFQPEKTTEYLKDQEELKLCTFKPKINKTKSKNSNSRVKIFKSYSNFLYDKNKSDDFCVDINNLNSSLKNFEERLINDNAKRVQKIIKMTSDKNNNDNKESTFKPNFYTSYYISRNSGNFEERTKQYQKKKEEKIKNIENDLEKNTMKECTFSPNIDFEDVNNKNLENKKKFNNFKESKSKEIVESSKSFFRNYLNKNFNLELLLREENENKIQKPDNLKEQLNKKYNLIYENEVHNIANNSNEKNKYATISFDNNISRSNINKSYSKRSFDDLYNDYKTLKNKRNKQQEKLDEEQGLTFKPILNNSNKIYLDKVKSNFYQREKEFLEKRQNDIKVFKSYLDSQEHPNKKVYTKKEVEDISSNVINRLYNKGLVKFINNKNDGNFDYKKGKLKEQINFWK